MQLVPWVLSLQVDADVPWNCRQAKGEVSQAWLTGASAVPGMTLLATWATLLRTMVVEPLLVVPAPMLVSHWAKPAPFVNPVLTKAVMPKYGGGLVLPPPV